MSNTATLSNSYLASSAAKRSTHRSLRAAWQMVILPRPTRGSLSDQQHVTDQQAGASSGDVRFDAPHSTFSTPHYLLNWSEMVGLHPASALEPLATPRKIGGDERSDRRPEVPRELADVLAEAAHDIRSPIAGALQALMMVTTQRRAGQNLDERELQLLQAAQIRLLTASRWAEDILSERNLTRRPHAGVRRRFYPDQWRQELLPVLRSAAEKQQVELEWDGWDRSLPRMYVDPQHLSRVVLNLVLNAIQASSQGSRVTIRAAAQSSSSQRLLISIEDRGLGLDAQLMRLINSSQPWPEAAANARNSGLGLRTVKTLTESMGGSISVQRGAQGGTLFRLALPVDDLRYLVRQWLMRHAAQEGLHPESKLAIYSLKTIDMDNELIDRHIQLSATEAEFVYRIGRSQWLWIQLVAPQSKHLVDIHALTSKLNLFGRRSQAHARCQAELISSLSELPFARRLAAFDDAQRLRGLLETINAHAQRLMDGRVPPLDFVTAGIDLPVESASAVASTSIENQSCSGGSATLAAEQQQAPAGAVTGLKQLRTPTPDTNAQLGKEQGDAARSISEVARQWRMIHSKLEKLHNRHLRSSPAM